MELKEEMRKKQFNTSNNLVKKEKWAIAYVEHTLKQESRGFSVKDRKLLE